MTTPPFHPDDLLHRVYQPLRHSLGEAMTRAASGLPCDRSALRPIEQFELVRAANIAPLLVFKGPLAPMVPPPPPGTGRAYRGLDAIQHEVDVAGHPFVVGFYNARITAVADAPGCLRVRTPGETRARLIGESPSTLEDAVGFAAMGRELAALESDVVALAAALAPFGAPPLAVLEYAFRPLRWAERFTSLRCFGPVTSAMALARLALGIEPQDYETPPCRIHDPAFVRGWCHDANLWALLAERGATIPPNEDEGDVENAVPEDLVGTPFRDLADPFTALLRVCTHGALVTRFHRGVMEIAVPSWRSE